MPKGKKDYKKKSGARLVMGKNGKQCITAWKKTKDAFFSIIATQRNKSQTVQSDTGKIWESWVVNILNKTTLESKVFNGLFEQKSGKLIIKELGWVINPKAPNGGYCGGFTK